MPVSREPGCEGRARTGIPVPKAEGTGPAPGTSAPFRQGSVTPQPRGLALSGRQASEVCPQRKPQTRGAADFRRRL